VNINNVGLSDGALVAIEHLVNPPEYTRDVDTQIVTDHSTNLQWQDDVNVSTVRKKWLTQANYDAANYFDTSGDTATTYCEDLTLGGHSDWRLPEISELLGIVDYGAMHPAINSIFQNVVFHTPYWSSTTYAGNSSRAWSVLFNNGGYAGIM